MVHVQVEGGREGEPLLLESDPAVEEELGLEMSDTLLQPAGDGRAQMVVANTSGITQQVLPGTKLGQVMRVAVVDNAGAGSSP